MIVGYSGKTEDAKAEFYNDMKRLLEITEMFNMGLINTFGDGSIIDTIF